MTSKIIGRKKELQLINEYYNSGRAEFVAIYGRRRIGKTFLVRQRFAREFAFDMTGVMEGSRAEQMASFHTAMKAQGYTGPKNKTWIDAFFALRQLLETKIESGKRCVIFIDELPCLDTPKSGFVNALGHFWNNWANWQNEIMLIVCGSATSWMVRNIIDNHGGLHDRITHEMHLHPFTLAETEEFFSENGYNWSRLSVLQAYMVVGGVPYYMSMFNRGESPAMGLDRLFFSPSGELRTEYNRLFSSLFRNPKPYIEIVNVLARNARGMTRAEISNTLEMSNNGNLGNMLSDLVHCDFVSKTMVRHKTVNENSAIYQLVDFYTVFYNTFNPKSITNANFWTQSLGTSEVNVWYGLAYERVCKAHMAQIKRAIGISGIRTEHYSWRSRQSKPAAQVDIIIDRADGIINLCEVKYSGERYRLDQEEFLNIQHRMNVFRAETETRSSIMPLLITTFGTSQGSYSEQIPLQLVLDDLFG